MSTLTSALLLPCGANVEPQPVLVEDYKTIQQLVGGNFDAVTTNCGGINNMLFVGYINDEGAVNGMEYNYLATNLFRREMYGDMVLVWGLNENHEYDGQNHDIPSEIYETLTETLTESTATAYNMSVGMASLCDFAIENGIISAEDMDRVLMDMYTESFSDSKSVKALVAKGVVRDVINDVQEFCEQHKDYEDNEENMYWALAQFCQIAKGAI